MSKTKQQKEVYICWVHNDVKQNTPGTCEKCTLYLVPEAGERELNVVGSVGRPLTTRKKQ